jgi:ankyrin repeat protein
VTHRGVAATARPWDRGRRIRHGFRLCWLVGAALLCQASCSRGPSPQERFSALCQAAQDGDLARVRDLLDAGAEPDRRTPQGWTALHCAAQARRPSASGDTIALLLERRAELEARNNDGQTPLALATLAGNEDAFRSLLAAGANIDTVDRHGTPLVSHAAATDRLPILRALLALRADVNRSDYAGISPLMYAVREGPDPEVVWLLLRHGAEPEHRDLVQRSVLEHVDDAAAPELQSWLRSALEADSHH